MERLDRGDHDFFLFAGLLDERAEESQFAFEVCGVGGGEVEGAVGNNGEDALGLHAGAGTAQHQSAWRAGTRDVEGTAWWGGHGVVRDLG